MHDSPGVFYLKDPRTNHFNFDQFLLKPPQPHEFDFSLLKPFVPASQDENLHQLANTNKCKYVSSTSAISGSLGTIYHFLNKSKPLQIDHMLTMAFNDEPKSLTAMTRAPSGIALKRHPKYRSVYSIMAEKPIDEPVNILAKLGHVMEKMFTENPSPFSQYLTTQKQPPNNVTLPTEMETKEPYNHAQYGKILLRSQIDCQDSRLPRKNFDLKTRASLPIRMDVFNYQRFFLRIISFRYLDYKVSTLTGLFESFEREFYDMCRSTMLKYK